MRGRLLQFGLAAAALAAAGGCSGDDSTTDGDVAEDGPGDEGSADETGGECTTDEECWDELFCNGVERCAAGGCVVGDAPCDDGIACTADVCNEDGAPRCTHRPDDAACGNGVACDGVELCLFDRGCAAGVPLDCNDDDPCTLDRCEEAPGGCVHDPRDLDGDTHATMEFGCDAWGGDDCDDGDEAVFPGATELCDDGRDNDCDGLADLEDRADCHVENDRCDGALGLTEGGRAVGSLVAASDDYDPACAVRAPDVVYSFVLTSTRNVVLGVDSLRPGAQLSAEVQTTCGDPATALGCSVYGPPMTLRFYSLPAGTYYLVVRGWEWLDELFVDYATSAPTAAPATDRCSAAGDLVPGTTAAGNLTGMNDDYRPSCFPGGGPDAFYRLVLTEPHQVTLGGRFTVSGPPLGLALMTTCGVGSSELECASGSVATITRNYLDAGTYYVAVDGEEYPFTLTATLGAPVTPPANDRCAGAVDVSASGTFEGDLARCYRDYPPSCSTDPLLDADVVYTFTTATARNLAVDLWPVAGTGPFAVALRSRCDDATTELRCRVFSPSVSFVQHSLPAGTYYLIVSGNPSAAVSRFLLQVGFAAPTPRPPGDTCADAVDASAGGSFSVVADGFDDDYPTNCGPAGLSDAVFGLILAEPRDLAVSLSAGSSNSTLQLYAGGCGATARPAGCITSLAPSGTIRDLPAGDYWLVVDAAPGFVGTLDVTLSPPG